MTSERLDELRLAPMARDSTALCGTGFTVSIDAKGRGMTTGISARDRAQTIRAAIDARSGPEDFARPGHVFPLRSRADGVLERRGHTEAAVDLARLADRTDTYGVAKQIPTKINDILTTTAGNPQEVADAVLSIVETPVGQRKLRYRVSRSKN